jgi:hypothetical protein
MIFSTTRRVSIMLHPSLYHNSTFYQSNAFRTFFPAPNISTFLFLPVPNLHRNFDR